MRSNSSLLIFIILSIIFVGCQSDTISKENRLIAKVAGVELRLNDLRDNFGNDFQLNDLNVKIYVHNWVRSQVVLSAAEKTLKEKDKDFSKELKEYKNSLLRYTFESKLVDSKIDTFVSPQQIQEYYLNNSKNFELKENFVKARILKVDRKNKDLNKIKNLFNYKDSLEKIRLEKEIDKYELFYLVYDSTWVKWQTVKEIVPFKPYNDEYFLSNNNYRELWQEKELWLIKISDFQLKDNISPLEMVESKIKSILINRRKMSLIKNEEEELYRTALKNGEIKLFLSTKLSDKSENKESKN